MRAVQALFCLCLAACSAPKGAGQVAAEQPMRIVSLDYCADQYVLKFADREQIAAISPDAGKSFSFMSASARGLARVRPTAEDVLALRPDVVVRSYGGGPQAAGLLEQAGIKVVQIGYAEDLNSIRRTAIETSARLGHPERGLAVVQEMEEALRAIRPKSRKPRTLYVTSAGVTTGSGSLVDELMTAAGLVNDETVPGWHPISLERIVYQPPDMTIAAFYDSSAHGQIWSSGIHPVLTRLRKQRPSVPIEGAWTSCGGWFVVEAVQAMNAGRHSPGSVP